MIDKTCLMRGGAVLFTILIVGNFLFAQTAVTVSPASASALAGGKVTVEVRVNNVTELHGASVTVLFDKSILKYESAAVGEFLASNIQGYNVFFVSQPKPISGPDTLIVDQAILGQASVSGSGVLFTVNYTALRAGTSPVTIASTDLRSGSNTRIAALATSGQVTVVPVIGNQPPSITSTAVQQATVGQLYQYQVAATDPDGDPLTYALTTAPTFLSVNPSSGLISGTPAVGHVGQHVVTVDVSDGKGGHATQNFILTVVQSNRAPTVTSTPGQQALVGQQYQYQVQATDPDGDLLTFSLITVPAFLSINSSTGLISGTPAVAHIGQHAVTVDASDGKGGHGTQSYTLYVSQGNRVPSITSISVQQALVGQQYQYQVLASDADGDPLTYSLTTAPPFLSINASTGLISGTPAVGHVGLHAVTVDVSDGKGGHATQNFTLTVSQNNRAPLVTSTPVLQALVGQLYQYQVQANDADGDPLTYTLTAAPSFLLISSTAGLIWGTPAASHVGQHSVVLDVSDGKGGHATQNFILSVAQANRPPSVTSVPVLQALVGEQYQYQVQASDADGDPLTYALTIAPPFLSINSSTGLITGTPVVSNVGQHTVIVDVNDGKGGHGTQSYTLSVVQGNRAPRIVSLPEETAFIGRLYQYQVRASDDDGDPLTYTLGAAPAFLAINASTGLISGTPSVTDIGQHTVALDVNDGKGGHASQTFGLLVSIYNRSPMITSTPVQQAYTGQPYSYQVQATDPDGDSLVYCLLVKPSFLSINKFTGMISGRLTTADVGQHTVSLRVDDGKGGGAEQTFTLTVLRSNTPPQITQYSPQRIKDTVGINAWRTFSVTAVDPDGDTLAYVWLRNGAYLVSGSEPSITLDFNKGGSYIIECRVSDGLAADTVRWSIFVNAMVLVEADHTASTGYSLEQNYPNPFNPLTTIRFSLAKPDHVNLRLHNVLGQEVAALVDRVVEPGEHSVVWSPRDLPSGTYFYRLDIGKGKSGFSASRKLILTR